VRQYIMSNFILVTNVLSDDSKPVKTKRYNKTVFTRPVTYVLTDGRHIESTKCSERKKELNEEIESIKQHALNGKLKVYFKNDGRLGGISISLI